MDNKKNEYLNKVISNVRWKASHKRIYKELEAHIDDQTDAYISSGMDEETALSYAVSEMGDPIIVGKEMNLLYRPQPCFGLILFIVTLAVIGITIQVMCEQNITNIIYPYVLGGICFVIIYHMNISVFVKHLMSFSVTATIISVALLYFDYYNPIISIKGMSKYTFLFYPFLLALVLCHYRHEQWKGIVKTAVFWGMQMFISLCFFTLNAAPIIFICGFFIMLYAILHKLTEIKSKITCIIYFIGISLIYLLAAGIYCYVRYSQYPTVFNNILTDQNMSNHSLASEYHTVVDWISQIPFKIHGQAVESDLSILPDSDYMLIHIAEKFGIGILIILAIAVLGFVGFVMIKCCKQKSFIAQIVSLAILTTYFVQVIIYVASNFNPHILAAYPMPFITSGGS
ncbi:MAG: hypothetical protein J6I45_10870, partial [Clostridia bacterium]|nr:hypothetical protein [Clostridia bacterium]